MTSVAVIAAAVGVPAGTAAAAVPIHAWTWVQQVGSPLNELAGDVATDAVGHSYVAGETVGTFPSAPETHAGGRDAFVAQFDHSGTLQWAHQLGTAGDDVSAAVTVDASGDVIVAGTTSGHLSGVPEMSIGHEDVFIARYRADGTRLWIHQLGSVRTDTAAGVAVDATGNSYVAGSTAGTVRFAAEHNSGKTDAFVTKYDANGARQWVHMLGGTAADTSGGIAIAPSGMVVIAGTSGGALPSAPETNAGGSDAFVAAYDGAGVRQWVHELGSASADGATDVAVSVHGDIVATGVTAGTLPGSPQQNAGADDAFAAAYSAAGAVMWVHELGSPGSDSASSVAIDDAGVAYLTGWTGGHMYGAPESSAGGTDVFIARIGRTGRLRWVHMLGSAGNERGAAIALTPGRVPLVAGDTDGTMPGAAGNLGGVDVFLAKY